MLDRAAALLVNVEDAIKQIRAYSAGLDQAAFLADAKTCDACALQISIIGESARALAQAARDEAPEIPWPKIVSLRNRIVHDYRSVDHAVVWEIIAHADLDALAIAVRRMLVARGEAID